MSHSPLLLQLVIILGTARLLGQLLKYCGQSAVIGEMAAGFMLEAESTALMNPMDNLTGRSGQGSSQMIYRFRKPR